MHVRQVAAIAADTTAFTSILVRGGFEACTGALSGGRGACQVTCMLREHISARRTERAVAIGPLARAQWRQRPDGALVAGDDTVPDVAHLARVLSPPSSGSSSLVLC